MSRPASSGRPVRVVERQQELLPDLDDVTSRERFAQTTDRVDQIPQGPAPHVLHREEGLPVDLGDLVHGDDVGVTQAPQQLRLRQEHSNEVGLVEVLPEHALDDAELVVRPEGHEQLPHAPAGEAVEQPVATEGAGVGLGHGPGPIRLVGASSGRRSTSDSRTLARRWTGSDRSGRSGRRCSGLSSPVGGEGVRASGGPALPSLGILASNAGPP
jgi:hypothetical protein